MVIFEKVVEFETKVNFVDINNVLVGYDLTTDCCEYADWLISDTIIDKLLNDHKTKNTIDIDEYVFDINFLEEKCIESEIRNGGCTESGSCFVVIFKMVDKNNKVKFLHLFNCHEGYYKHGFEMRHKNELLKEGKI